MRRLMQIGMVVLVGLWGAGGVTPAYAQGRQVLTAPLFVAVSPIESASDVIRTLQRTIDTANYPVILTLTAGTHATVAMQGPLHGGGWLYVVGEGPATQVQGVVASSGAQLVLGSLTLAHPTGSGLSAVFAPTHVTLDTGVVFGPSHAEHLVASFGAMIHAVGRLTVTGSAVSFAHAYARGYVLIAGGADFVGVPTFQAYVFGVADASMGFHGGFTGEVIGQSCLVHYVAFFGVGPEGTVPGQGGCTPAGVDAVVLGVRP